MEPAGAFLDEEWESLSRIFSTGHNEHGSIFNMDMGPIDESLLIHSDTFTTNLHYLSQESCSNNTGFFSNPSTQNTYFGDSNYFQESQNTVDSMDFWAMDNANNLCIPNGPNDAIGDLLCLNEEETTASFADSGKQMEMVKRKSETLEEKKNALISETPKKKPRVSRDAHKGKKNVTSKKNQKLSLNGNGDEEEANNNVGIANGQSSSCCSSEDDSNACHEELINGGETSQSKGKSRASRGAATDPQSLYARRRRERINERLKILQSLVPNGTKVDISTMLEEAVHYVKFLQLQIKVLSSDDMWMYAPIAYNGMDIGLYRKISPTL